MRPRALPLYSYTLVALQGLALLGVIWPFVPVAGSAWGWVLLMAGTALGIWAVWLHSDQGLTPLPHPKGDLITHGPYRWVRHPMYLSLVLFALGMIIWRAQWVTVIASLALVAVLVFKIRHEEALLRTYFSAYDHYRRHTWALIPGIW